MSCIRSCSAQFTVRLVLKSIQWVRTVLVVLSAVSPAKPRAQSKVCESNVSIMVYQDIVGLYVAVDETHCVDRLNSQHQLCNVELGEFMFKDLLFDQQAHQISARNVVHHKVQMWHVLYTTTHTHQITPCLDNSWKVWLSKPFSSFMFQYVPTVL